MSITYIHNNGQVGTSEATNMLKNEAGNVLVHFASADGNFGQVSKLHRSFQQVHSGATRFFDTLAQKGQIQVGRVRPLVTRKGQENEKLILFAAHKATTKDDVSLDTVIRLLKAIHGWAIQQDAEKTIIAIAPIGGRTKWDDSETKDGEIIPGLGKLYAQYLDTLDCTVNVFIGQYAPEYYADGRVVEIERPDENLPDYEPVEGEVAPQTQVHVQAQDTDPGEDPFLPEYPEQEEEEKRQYSDIEAEVELEEQETNMSQAMSKAERLADAFNARA